MTTENEYERDILLGALGKVESDTSTIADRIKQGRVRVQASRFQPEIKKVKKRVKKNIEIDTRPRGRVYYKMGSDKIDDEEHESGEDDIEFKDIIGEDDIMIDTETGEKTYSAKITMGLEGERSAISELGPVNNIDTIWTTDRLEHQFPIELDKQIPKDEIVRLQRRDKTLLEVYYWLKNKSIPPKKQLKFKGKECYFYKNIFNFLELDEHNIIVYRDPHQDGKALICLPDALIDKVFYMTHELQTSAHFGIGSTIKRQRYRFIYPNMTSHIASRLMICQGCTQKTATAPYKHTVFCTREVGACNAKVCWDLIGPLPTTPDGNVYILSVMDYFSRYCNFIPVPSKRADVIAKALFYHWICIFGSFEVLHADNSLENRSELNREVCRALGVYQTFIPIYRAGGNRCERSHRTIFACIRALIGTKKKDEWESLLHPVKMAYNSSVHSGTGQTPFYLWHGREMRIPLDLQFGIDENKYESTSDFAIKLVEDIKKSYEMVNHFHQNVALREETAYSRRPQIREFEVGDKVLYFSPYRKPGTTKKLHLHFTGPFRIVSKISSILYEILTLEDKQGAQPILATNDRLKGWHDHQNVGPSIKVRMPFIITEGCDGYSNILDNELTREVVIQEFQDVPIERDKPPILQDENVENPIKHSTPLKLDHNHELNQYNESAASSFLHSQLMDARLTQFNNNSHHTNTKPVSVQSDNIIKKKITFGGDELGRMNLENVMPDSRTAKRPREENPSDNDNDANNRTETVFPPTKVIREHQLTLIPLEEVEGESDISDLDIKDIESLP